MSVPRATAKGTWGVEHDQIVFITHFILVVQHIYYNYDSKQKLNKKYLFLDFLTSTGLSLV